jgi:hypothetical protein
VLFEKITALNASSLINVGPGGLLLNKSIHLDQKNCTHTSTRSMMNSDVIMGKMQRASGVVRSVNQNAPPAFKDGTFSTMFDI